MIDLWYKNAVIYSIDVDSFCDSDGDGIGDFAGLTSKLDYLASLNITCLWLLPFYPTPNRDNGYDVTDFYGVDERLGTLGDFVEFTRQARERGIRVLIDLVVNHTSIDHPWFERAREERDSRFRDFYVWSDEKPENADEGMVFPGEQESTWTYDEKAGAWYFHRFFAHQPDLNVSNPLVRREIARIMSFWLQLGVSGFRVDAVPFLIELRGIDDAGGRAPQEFLREFRMYLSWRQGDAVMLAEANIAPDEVTDYFGDGDKLQMMFNFYVNQHLFLGLATEDARPIARAYAQLADIPPVCQWANFLRNHDELDLGRLTGDQRERTLAAFGPEARMQLFHRGIRRRLAPMLDGDRRRIELAFSLMLTLPGTPVFWYGDEIGMGEDLTLEGRDSVRTPMQWADAPNGGFSSAASTRLLRPVIDSGPFGFREVNVESQRRDGGSLLAWVEKVLRVRRECPEFGWGACTFVETGADAVLAHRCRRSGRSVLVVHNLSSTEQSITLPLLDGTEAHDLLNNDGRPEGRGELTLSVPPFGYYWLREAGQPEGSSHADDVAE